MEIASTGADGQTPRPSSRQRNAFDGLTSIYALGIKASLALNQVRLRDPADRRLTLVTQPTAIQKRAFELLGVKPDRGVPINMTG